MKTCNLFILNRSLASQATSANPWRLVNAALLSPFASVKPVNHEPVQAAWEANSLALESSPRTERGTKIETNLLRFAGLALLGILVLCGFGVQQVAHNREKARWSRLLQQKEMDLACLTQAYRAMETSVARRSGQDLQPPAVLPAIARQSVPAPGRSAQSGQIFASVQQTQRPGTLVLSPSRPVMLVKATKSRSGARS
jgi:hypothetical protein